MTKHILSALLFGWFAILALPVLSSAAMLSVEGKATASIVLGASATKPEQTAAEELSSYLTKVTGGRFAIVKESKIASCETGIYLGSTLYAERHNLRPSSFESEQWVIRTIDQNIVLIGGHPRGTLYAVFHFLEDIIGVRWWNPFEETVPLKPTLVVNELDRQGRPVFDYREIFMLYGYDSGRFAVHSRLNGQGDAPIIAKYGGGIDYGLPYRVHTFYRYIPPKTYLKSHPEWFSLINGERSAKQLCLTNQELRDTFVIKLKTYIKESALTAQKDGRVAPAIFDISPNDREGMCQCEKCRVVTRAEGAESGLLLDFVNYIADSVKDQYPDIYISTLAYEVTKKVPGNIKPRNNVLIRLCDTGSNYTRSIIDPVNHEFKNLLLDWAKITNNLQIWDYAVTYTPYYGLPLPTVHTYANDYRYYVEHGVEGVFSEFEYPILADMRDLKLWIMAKLLEDPYQDYEQLLRQFTDEFYGQAGSYIRRYLELLQKAVEDYPDTLSIRQYRYIDLEFVKEAMAVFDQAEHAVNNNPVWLRRVQHARLPLDRATLVFFPRLSKQWFQQGGKSGKMPLDREVIAERCLSTWETQINLRIKANRRAAELDRARKEISFLRAHSGFSTPQKFKNISPDRLFDHTAELTRNHKNIVKKVPDDQAETGVTNRLELSDEDMKKYKLPMYWGLYNLGERHLIKSSTIQSSDVPGPGYHWYKIGPVVIAPKSYVYFFWSWIIQLDVNHLFDPSKPNQEFEIWASIKFEGPGFPHGKFRDKNAICVERIVLIKKQ